MLSRRDFLAVSGSSLLASPFAVANAAETQHKQKKRLAVVTTLWDYGKHAWHMATRFLVGYPRNGRWHEPGLEVVSAYVDQQPETDLSKARAREFGFTIYPTVAEALRCGGDRLAVDAVLLIGEHGNYPKNEIGQKLYPRYELFMKIADVFKADGRSTPVFNDKHLSWNFDWAKEMVETSRELNFPFQAGSSLPVTWRMPSIEMPLGADIEEALVVAHGPTDIYDFHALETLQCMVERRRGGETGVKSMHALQGDAVWESLKTKSWADGGVDPVLFEACLSRSHTLKQPPTFSHRYPTADQMREWVKNPIAYRFEYNDGTQATMLLMNGLVADFTFAARLKNHRQPVSSLFYLPPTPNVVYSAALMDNAEQMFLSGKARYPVERTMLTSGLVQAGLQSLHDGKKLETPHLAAVEYEPANESTFWRS